MSYNYNMPGDPRPGAGDKIKLIIEKRIPLEHEEQLKKVVFNDGALAALRLTTERYMQHGFNDLLVFLTSPGQDGNTRIVDRVAVLENDTPNTPFRGDLGMEIERLREQDPDLKTMTPVGLGSVAGYLENVRAYLKLGYKFYASCGDELYGNGRTPNVADAGYWAVWSLDGEDITQIESVVETNSK